MPAIRMFDLGCIDNRVMRTNEGEEKGEEDGETDGSTEGKPDSVDLELWQKDKHSQHSHNTRQTTI